MTTFALIIGPGGHGVVRLAEQIAAVDPTVTVVRHQHAETVLTGDAQFRPGAADRVHVHFTDGLFGTHCDRAADTFCRLAGTIAGAVSVTLHDVPHHQAGPSERYARRAAAYRRVAHAAHRVVVSSASEAAEVARLAGVAAEVIALPLDRAPGSLDRSTDPVVGLVGFVYPGKGHARALHSMGSLPAEAGCVILGRAADGHDDLLGELAELARLTGRSLHVTGYLGDAALSAAMRRVRVPLAAHESISASGSIGSWLSVGRRPLVPDGPWTRELEQRIPGCVRRVAAFEGLDAALAAAWHDPASTWLDDDVELTPSTTQVAAAYAALYAR